MRTALVESRHASASFRWMVLVLSAGVVGCSGKPASGALQVLVNLEAGLKSRCVKVLATDGSASKETGNIMLAGKSSPLHVAVYGDGLVQPVTVQAIGFSDDGCTARSGEVSESLEGRFTSPPSTVTLTLRPVSSGDGGFNPDGGSDGGLGDAGVDAGTGDAGGFDAGVDADGDGSALPADCDDTNPDIHPGAAESCTNGIDDDCDSKADCQQGSCDGFVCTGAGVCVASVCVAPTEVLCNDGVDNDGDGRIDCADADCPVGTQCNDNNGCTSGDRCVADGGCEKTTDTACDAPPNALCWATAGVCLPDAGATCEYTQLSGNCNDGLACTTADTCTSGTCGGAPKPCNAPGNVCLASTGSCKEPSGNCSYAPLATGACNDGQNCTVNDSCDGDGGCVGTAVSCTAPSQCHSFTGSCAVDAGCNFNPRTGQACDAGTGLGAASCDSSFNCNPPAANLFTYTPSNFTEAELPSGAATAFTVSCATTLNTSGTPAITNGSCVTMPPFVIITQGGESTVLVKVPSLTVNSGQTLTITGTRPVIFAVLGNVLVDGTIRATNPGAPSACGNGGNGGVVSGEGGGGGGGFGTTGAVGGVRSTGGAGALGAPNGVNTLVPLRSGCRGGNGNGSGGTGGAGGGALQISATGTISVTSAGIVTAPGLGGGGATGTDDSGGGGGSGGALLLEAPSLQFDSGSWLSANGGGGGGGEDGGDGIAGDPGSQNSTTAAAGGNANNNAGAGGRGATRTTSVQAGAASTAGNAGAGGGGGGMGRIRLNATSCTVDGASNRTPAATSTGTNCP